MPDFIGAVLVLVCFGYLVAIFDDLIFDAAYLFRRRRFQQAGLSKEELESDNPKRIAVMVAAWQEAGVVAKMAKATYRLMRYPEDRIEFFIGVYPNDEATLHEVRELSKSNPRVHCVVNQKPGPTSKSQNLNEVFAFIQDLENIRNQAFDVIALHDAEDVIHPYAFRFYSALLSRHDMVQLPVIAMFPRLPWWRWLNRIVSGTYADEFAESHLHHMPIREGFGLFVPSAGTGFALRREVVSFLAAEGPVFREGNLTEDYDMSLRLWQKGFRVHFHVQRLKRIDDRGRVCNEVVGIKEYFPFEIPAAVKQKARWIYGITMQSPKETGLKRLRLKERLILWRDWKGKYTNLIHFVGYPLALYSVLAYFLDWPHADPRLMLVLSGGVLLITLERLLMRFAAIKSVYGVAEALQATVVLPLFPLRWFVGNIINALATLRAWRMYFWPARGARKGATPVWDKTERKSYVPAEVLESVRRRLGDVLLFYGDVSPQELALALRTKPSGVPLGEILLRNQTLDPDRLRLRITETQERLQNESKVSAITANK
ncbi:glycosyl transferase family protein [Meiothermus ruber]|jgi:adsorption protein B|uniref:Bacteriophage N4 adsorption protein B n=1 Tax=Meiothermus ruber (strain ATCC 35948 / DSM 1279 / VKM B-1258 / 21) TaxID=504728 RepID=D3PRI8_MEIRD|nr:glycosyl transferase family protein [Meiothermus ruber]ADD28071.1 bacteriophage N4 receptor, inner membrane subunit [Meiothermus ruber DSM 1279]AGK04540.1 bacteriophage N4 adsorption protein B [Meiothermus ruber DSM 1279]MCL6528782.1 glycosyl transferase family protein [Meiothermus ruber]GAO75018.1 bacteriophage N4 receptor, inner membrane subunit [Meiothermus ruber H328]